MTTHNVWRADVSVVVMGVSGSGKSTVGRALADRLALPFADADDLHPQANIAKMSAGIPLDDGDREPWLAAVGRWLARHHPAVVSCSALKRSYRDHIRSQEPDLVFLWLTGSPELIQGRQAHRPGHFMPASLLRSQFDALEPLRPDEDGVAVDVGRSIDNIVEDFVGYLSAKR